MIQGCAMIDLQFIPIRSPDDLLNFDCGNASINILVKQSYLPQLTKQSKTFQISVGGHRVGAYSLSMATINAEDGPPSLANYYEGTPRFCAVVLHFIAIEKSFQNLGLGTKLLGLIANQVRELSNSWPVRILYLDALSDKIDWYKANGFQLFAEPQNRAESTVPMYLDLLSVAEEHALQLLAESI